MARTLLLSLALLSVLPAAAQHPAQSRAGSDWLYVQALPAGASIYVSPKTGKTFPCRFTSADTEALTCTVNRFPTPIALPRSEIKTVKLARRTRSTWPGFGIGYPGGAAVGRIFGETQPNSLVGSLAIGVGALAGIIAGSVIGHITDFTRSTVYRAN